MLTYGIAVYVHALEANQVRSFRHQGSGSSRRSCGDPAAHTHAQMTLPRKSMLLRSFCSPLADIEVTPLEMASSAQAQDWLDHLTHYAIRAKKR